MGKGENGFSWGRGLLSYHTEKDMLYGNWGCLADLAVTVGFSHREWVSRSPYRMGKGKMASPSDALRPASSCFFPQLG